MTENFFERISPIFIRVIYINISGEEKNSYVVQLIQET